MAEVLKVDVRSEVGSNAVKRVRRAGYVPAVLYGHGEANVNLAIPAETLLSAVRRGSRLVELQGGVSETALIRGIQWDTYGLEVLHLDLARVSASEMVRVRLSLELRGEAPGTREGGIVEQVLHDVEIECPASAIPERIEVNVRGLHLGGAIKLSDVSLPTDARLLGDPEDLVVHCVAPAAAEVEEVAPAAEAAEPEVIGRKPAEEAEGEE
jgi:large subunit ribosomal protein L25